MSQVQKEIQETLEQIQNLKRIEKHYRAAENDVSNARIKLVELEKILEKEYADVQALESLSVKSLFHKVLGSQEEQIEKERQEYLQASLKYHEFKKTVEIQEFEMSILEKKMTDIALLQNKLETLKKRRQRELLSGHSVKASELKRILFRKDQIHVALKEMTETMEVGSIAIQHLDKMIGFLNQARNWGNWDMMGKGRQASYYKHDAIDRAKDAAYRTKHALEKFRQELYDLGTESSEFDLGMDGFSRFTDIFFDNLISDWIIQQKVKNALANVHSVKDKVIRILQTLSSDNKLLDAKLIDLEKEKDQFLLTG